MPSSATLSPSPSSGGFEITLPPQRRSAAAVTMLKIHSLLNPQSDTGNSDQHVVPTSAPPTPISTVRSTSPASTPQLVAPVTPSFPRMRQKLVKDAAVFLPGPFKGPVNFPPFECTEQRVCLTSEQEQTLALQHRRFEIFPSGQRNEGLISDYVRHIPYSSEKKSFLNKTGREAFDVFQYTFIVPGDTDKRTHVVMWDYHIGLVRITPFFKACKYSKTTPAKALTSNKGLRELSHSITGGALAAQGYWMPYACARAICLTFCYPIRWALTPLFGPSFVKECLRPEHPGFARFKVDPEVIRCATLESEGWKPTEHDRPGTPMSDSEQRHIPRSAPSSGLAGPQPVPRSCGPNFKSQSPFDEGTDGAGLHSYTHTQNTIGSPQISPKSQHAPLDGPSWTCINSPSPSSLPMPYNPSVHSTPFLTEPRFSPATSWRAGNAFEHRTIPASTAWEPPLAAVEHDDNASPPLTTGHHMMTRRSTATAQAMDIDNSNKSASRSSSSSSSSASESDDVDIPREPLAKKRKLSTGRPKPTPSSKGKSPGSKFTAADMRAAHWLLNLSSRDQQLAAKCPSPVAGQKRKASS